MATKTVKAKAEAPTTWYVVLHLVDGRVEPQLEWWKKMKVHDKVKFLSPDGTVQVKFKPEGANGKDESAVNGLYPFGEKHKKIIGDSQPTFEVINSCKSLMSCSIIKDGAIYTYEGRLAPGARWPNEDTDRKDSGTHICTGGGDKPVVCN
jgi:hypothetical protein